MEQPFIDIDLGFYARLTQVLHIAKCLTIKRFPRAYEGVGRRQAVVVRLARRRSLGRNGRRTIELPEVHLPAEMVADGVPAEVVVVARGVRVPVVDHRVEGHMVRYPHLPPVACELAERSTQAAARTLPAYEDLVGADSQLPGVGGHVQKSRVAVFQRVRVTPASPEPVGRAYDYAAMASHQALAHAEQARHSGEAGEVAPAVDPQHPGLRSAPPPLGPVYEHLHLPAALAVYIDFAHLHRWKKSMQYNDNFLAFQL